MIIVEELNSIDKNSITEIAALHKKAFPSFFLTQLGMSFLQTLYFGYLHDKQSGIIVAKDNGQIVGFIAYSNDYSQFYKGLIKHHLIKFAFSSFGAAIKHPSFVKRLFGAFNKSESVAREENYVELASICVDPKKKNLGIGSLLIDYLKSIVDFSNYSYINLETDALDNDSVNSFYKKNGFELTNKYVTTEGREMNEYRFWRK